MLHFSNISLAINHIYITFLFVTGQVVGSHIIRKIFKHFSVICPCIFLLNMAGTRSICTFFFLNFWHFWGAFWPSFTFLFITWKVVDAHVLRKFFQHFFGNLTFSYLPPRSMAGCGHWPADQRGRRRAGGLGWWPVLLE